jgi:hypothetical protein
LDQSGQSWILARDGLSANIRTSQPDSRFDIFQFSCRFNPGTNRGNVEMALINKSCLVTLNQRVPGSSPGAPTIILLQTIDNPKDRWEPAAVEDIFGKLLGT